MRQRVLVLAFLSLLVAACVCQTCGDGIVTQGEECDDANSVETDSCRNNCTLSKVCEPFVVQYIDTFENQTYTNSYGNGNFTVYAWKEADLFSVDHDPTDGRVTISNGTLSFQGTGSTMTSGSAKRRFPAHQRNATSVSSYESATITIRISVLQGLSFRVRLYCLTGDCIDNNTAIYTQCFTVDSESATCSSEQNDSDIIEQASNLFENYNISIPINTSYVDELYDIEFEIIDTTGSYQELSIDQVEISYISQTLECDICGVYLYEDDPLNTLTEIYVTTTSDVIDPTDGFISLREAISIANNRIGNETIYIDPAEYLVYPTIVSDDEQNCVGDFDVGWSRAETINIIGVNTNDCVINGQHSNRIFHVHENSTLVLSYMSLINGAAVSDIKNGGAILLFPGSNSDLSNVRIESNSAISRGGAVFLDSASLSMINTSLLSNNASSAGAIRTIDSYIKIETCNIAFNEASNNGGFIISSFSNITIYDSLINNNRAVIGGAIESFYSSIEIESTKFTRNVAYRSGAIDLNGGALKVYDSVFESNEADRFSAGAVHAVSSSVLTFNDTNMINNTCTTFGAAIYLGTECSMYYYRGSVVSNVAGDYGGGLILVNVGDAYFEQVTISGNQAQMGGGILLFRYSSSTAPPTNMTLYSCTVVNNTSTESNGAGGIQFSTQGNSTLSLRNTIVGENIATSIYSADILSSDNLDGFISLGYNLIGDTSGIAATYFEMSDILDVDPLIAPLADNGGETFTHLLLGQSPAINAGMLLNSIQLQYDQRGVPFERVVEGSVDIGALELQNPPEPCDMINCDDNNECTEDSCDPIEGCINTSLSGSVCDDGVEDGECQNADVCVSGVCTSGSVNDTRCESDARFNDQCYTFEGCSNTTFTCIFTANTQSCDDGNACTVNDQCDGSGNCVGTALDCDDGYSCTTDSCEDGMCVYDLVDSECAADLGSCSIASCDPTNTTYPVDNNGCIYVDIDANCNDGIPCTEDSCLNGTCQYNFIDLQCSMFADSCLTGICDPDNTTYVVESDGCVYLDDNQKCDDGYLCTTDICTNGTCSHDFVDSQCSMFASTCLTGICDPDNSTYPVESDGCTYVDDSDKCDDGFYCTTDSCTDGVCNYEYLDSQCTMFPDTCFTGICSPSNTSYPVESDGCVYTDDNTKCDDGDPCTLNDSCLQGTCRPGTLVNCSTLDDQCVEGVCNSSTGLCEAVNLVDGTNCDVAPSGYCGRQDTCISGVCTEGGADDSLCVDDGYVCSIEFCDVDTQTCDATLEDSVCTIAGATCSVDLCSPSSMMPLPDTKGCIHEANDMLCEDGYFCDGVQFCNETTFQCETEDVSAEVLAPPHCSDGIPCTDDFCDEINDLCVNIPLDSNCDDGNICNGNETCSSTHGCIQGTSLACLPRGPCETASCDAVLGCVYTPLSSDTVCRASEGVCDPVEHCDGLTPDCPVDQLHDTQTICRPSAGACDIAETCSGISTECPMDEVVDTGTVCRPSAGACDEPETCDGTSNVCPVDQVSPHDTPCRPPAGPCDKQETCDGASTACPADELSSIDTVCRPAAGLCDIEETCDGVSIDCPTDNVLSQGIVCRAAFVPGPGGPGTCDAEEICNGVDATCPPDSLLPAGTTCRASIGPCDLEETCDGTSVSCPSNQLAQAGTVCRPAIGDCDQPEVCSGSSSSCPDDILRPPGFLCRNSTNECDLPSTCDGTDPECAENSDDSSLCTGGSESGCTVKECVMGMCEDVGVADNLGVFADDFSVESFNNSVGSRDWSGFMWIEELDDGLSGLSNTSKAGIELPSERLVLRHRGGSEKYVSWTRKVPLDTNELTQVNDRVTLELQVVVVQSLAYVAVSSNGVDFDVLECYYDNVFESVCSTEFPQALAVSPTTQRTRILDITSYATPNTTIRISYVNGYSVSGIPRLEISKVSVSVGTVQCDDADVCTQGDLCKNGVCVGLASLICDDGNECTEDSCDPVLGCVNDDVAVEGRLCDADTQDCTVADVCVSGNCVPGQRLYRSCYVCRGSDAFRMGNMILDFASTPIPAGFFEQDSDEFSGQLIMTGSSLDIVGSSPTGEIHLILERLSDADLVEPGGTETVPMRVSAFSIQSSTLFESSVNGTASTRLWDIHCALSPNVPQQQLSLTINASNCSCTEGGVFIPEATTLSLICSFYEVHSNGTSTMEPLMLDNITFTALPSTPMPWQPRNGGFDILQVASEGTRVKKFGSSDGVVVHVLGGLGDFYPGLRVDKFDNICTEQCMSDAECDDGLACTIDSCEVSDVSGVKYCSNRYDSAVGAPCGLNIGECEAGIGSCIEPSGDFVCIGAKDPIPERADGLDNDCNGIIDG